MADFDKDLKPIIKPTGYSASNIPIGPGMNFSSEGGGGTSDLSQKEDIFSELKAAGQASSPIRPFVTNSQLEANKRYKYFNPTIGDYEDFAAQGQSAYKQAANGVLKGVNLAATTVAGGFGTLYGIGKAIAPGGKFSDIYENEVMTSLDKWNTYIDNEVLPNYYTAAERNAEWYSTDNWFTTNFLFDKLIKNSGFAVGAMVGGNIANAGLLAAGTKLGGLAAKGAAAAEASQAFKLFTPLLRNTARAFSAGKNAEAAALLESQISSIADLSAKSATLSNISKQTATQFAKFSDASRRTAVAAYSSAGEASFEALQSAKEFRDNLIEEYARENGYAPTGEDLKNINLESEKVGKTSFYGNMALLAITEYAQLPYLIGSNYNASRQAANSLLGKVDNFAIDETGKYVAKAGPKTKFGKLYEGTKRVGAYVFDPKESAQEVLQYALGIGTQNYFKKSEEGGEADMYVDGVLYGLMGKDKYGEGIGALVSKEGIEGGILGGITGGAMQARGSYLDKKATATNTEKFLNMINNAPTFKEAFKDKLAATNRGIVLHQQHRDAIINGDRLEERDLNSDLIHTYLAPRIKYGRFDMVTEDLNELKSAGISEQGLNDLKQQGLANINDTVESFQKRINTLQNSAKDLNDLYQSLNLRYSGETVEVNGEEIRKYPPAVIDMLAYAGSKIANYDVRIPQLNSKIAGAGINTQAILEGIIETGVPNAEATKEALDIINSMNVTSDVKDELKGTLDDVIELSLRRKMFIDEYDGIKNNPLNYVRVAEEISEVEVSQKEGRKKSKKVLEVGKSYSLAEPIVLEKGKIVLAPKVTVVSSTLGGEYEVQLPDGSSTFFSPQQFDKYNLVEEDNASQELEDALNQSIDEVLDSPAFSKTVEKPEQGVNKLAYINSLANQKLIKAVITKFNQVAKDVIDAKAKAKEIAEKIKQSKSSLDKQQDEFSNEKDPESFVINQLPDSVGQERISTGETGALKGASDYFDSSTTESEDPKFNSKIAEAPAHVRRSRIFLNNARKFKNRNKLRAIVFTYKQEASLGLSGITALSYKTSQEEIDADPNAFETKVTNEDNGFVAVVFVEVEKGKSYFVDQSGNRIGEVGQQVDLGKVIFQTMPTTSVQDSKGKDRYREAEMADFEKFAKIWKTRRVELLKGKVTPMLEFNVSKGFPITQMGSDGLYLKNSVTKDLVDLPTLIKTFGLINVVTTDTIVHNGKIISAKKGHVYIQNGELIQYLNNNKLGKEKAETAYQLIKSIVTKLQKDASEGKVPEFEKNKSLFLGNLLNYKNPKGELSDNQIWFDTNNLTVKLGKTSYSFNEIANSENKIINQLSDVYHSANAKTVRLPASTKFYEYSYKDGKLSEIEWPNYQTYLASGKDSTGKNARPTDQIPFVTIANPTEVQPYSFAGKYATFINFELGAEGYVPEEKDQQDPPKSSSKQSPPPPSEVVVTDLALIAGPYELNSGKENTIEYKAGLFRFKANLLPDGNVEIDIISEETNKETFINLSKNEKVIATTRTLFPKQSENANDEQVAKIYLMWNAGEKVQQALAEEQVKQAPPQAPVSDIKTNQLTVEEADWLYDNLRQVTNKYDSYTLADSVDPNLKTPLQFGDTTVTAIEPMAGDKSHIWFERSTGKWLISIEEKNGKQYLILSKFNDKGTYYAQSISEEELQKLIDTSGLRNLIDSIYKDTNIKQPETRRDQFETQNALQQKYGLKRTYKDIIKELTPLEKTKPAKQEPSVDLPVEDLDFDSGVDSDAPFRKIALGEIGERIDDRDLEAFKEWHAKTVPNLPFEVLENIISVNSTEKAWGVFENGIAKFFKSGLRGTEYHEIFEGIWKAFLTDVQRKAVLNEFKAKSGEFLDRETGKLVAYSQSTDKQAKERIADDFADFRVGKLSARSLSQRIRNLFNSILEFFKSFVQKPSLKKELFESIEAGKFKEFTVSDAVKSASPEYRKINIPQGGYLPEDTAWALVQDMTITMADYIFNRNNSGGLEKLYYPETVTGGEVYNYLRKRYENNITKLGEDAFKELFLRSKELIRTLGVSIDTEGIQSVNDSEQTNRLYSPEAFEVDLKKNMSFSVKFMLATNPATKTNYDVTEGAPELLTFVNSNGKKTKLTILSNYNRLFSTLINQLSNTSLAKVNEKFIELVRNDGNYYRLFSRLRGDVKNGVIDFDKFDKNDLRFYIQFVQSFNKSQPFVEIAVNRKGESGIESFTIPGDRTSALYKIRNDWFQNIKKLSESETSFVKKDVKITKQGRKVVYVINDKQQYYPTRKELLNVPRLENYLKNIGIDFPGILIEKIYKNKSLKNKFDNAVKGIYERGPNGYSLLGGDKFLEVDSFVRTLADLYVRAENPDQDTTRLNIKNKRSGNFSDSNAPSIFESDFNDSMTFEELLKARPELADAFSKNSLILQKGESAMFFDEDGTKKEGEVLRIGVIDGLKDELLDTGVSISEMTKGQRFTVEVNQNINGNYYVLIPADSSTERMIKFGSFVDYQLFNDEGNRAYNRIYEIYKGYLEDEITLALDWENRSKLSATKNNAKELRFFKDILEPSLVEKIHNEILKATDENVPDDQKPSGEDIINLVFSEKENSDAFEQSIRNTVNDQNQKLLNDLVEGGEVTNVNITPTQSGYNYPLLDSKFAYDNKLNKSVLTENEMMQVLSFVNMNYMIANIEMHKFIFGDPYQFKITNGKLDETKRIKSWLSPRRITVDTQEINTTLNKLYGDVTDTISLDADDMFSYEFKSFVKTATLNDVNPTSAFLKQFSGYDESDGFSIMMDSAYREVKLKNGEWKEDTAEPWFQWNQSYARQKLSEKGIYKGYDNNNALREHDENLIKQPQPPYVTEVLKTIASGSKHKLDRIEAVIDKMSQMPISYKMVEGTNLENLYVQMLDQKVGYVIYKSARKEGARKGHDVYKNGEYNLSTFENDTIENVAWSTYGIQLENTYEEGKTQTRVSQLTKNDTMDMFDNGKETKGFEGAATLAKEKIKVFKEMHENYFQQFLTRLGIVDLGGSYEVVDPVRVSQELEKELMKRQLSQNAIDTIRLDELGQFTMPFEASSAYEQIRGVLIAMVNNSLVSPSMSGKPHVQVPATMWENAAKGRQLLRKTGNEKVGYTYEKITKVQYDALSETDKGSVVLASDTLKFYEDVDGKRYMEVMIPNFWKKYFTDKKRFPNDASILKYLNQPENQKILFGVGARIPHQAMSSTEVFKIAGFLDVSMGSTVVVPSEIVAKAGSDFDIDKLNMYLKSVYVDQNDNVKLIEYKGSKEATIEFYNNVYDETIKNEITQIEDGDKFREDVLEVLDIFESIENPSTIEAEGLSFLLGNKLFKFFSKYQKTINEIIEQASLKKQLPSDYIGDQIGRMANKYEKLSIEKINFNLKKEFSEKMYKKSLENRYYEILQGLITLPGNFSRLMSPINDAGLSKVAEIIDTATNNNEGDLKNKLISKSFMTSLRHAFVMAKKWVGISAVNITGHAIGQQVGLYFDSKQLSKLSDYDRSFLRGMKFSVPYNAVMVDGFPMMSLGSRLTADGQNKFISDRLSGYATAFVDVAKDPYILKIIQSDLVVGTGMLMERIGVGELTPYFLRQPIIVEYLKMLDRKKSRSLFGKNNTDAIRNMYPVEEDVTYDLSDDFVRKPDGTVDFEKSRENLLSSIIENTNRPKDVKASSQFNAKQLAVFDEFLALSKLSQLNFKFSQAYNYDTTRVRNYEGFKRKLTRTTSAQTNNIISSIDKVMNQTFIGDQMKLIRKELKALGAIMKLDSVEIEQYIDVVMEPFYNDEFMSADDFDYVAKKLKNSFLDYVIQTNLPSVNSKDLQQLFSGKNSVASKLVKLKSEENYPSILKYLIPFNSLQENGPSTVALRVKPTDAIDVNRHIGMMIELKEKEPEFYNDLVKLSILQGTFETNLSISSIIPVEDRAKIIAPIITAIKPSKKLETFNKEGLFYRNNFTDDRIVPEITPNYNNGMRKESTNVEINYSSVDTFFLVPSLNLLPSNPQIIKINNKFSFINNADSDFVKMKRYQFVNAAIETVVIDVATGKQMTTSVFRDLSNLGKISPSELIGYKKVKSEDGLPFTYQVISKRATNEFSIFKMVNLYGSARIVNEYPALMTPSVFDNNTLKVPAELTDNDIIDMLSGDKVEVVTDTVIVPASSTVSQVAQEELPSEFESLFSKERQEEILSNFAKKHNMSKEEALSYIKDAFIKDRESVISKLNECY